MSFALEFGQKVHFSFLLFVHDNDKVYSPFSGFKNWLNFLLTPPEDEAQLENETTRGNASMFVSFCGDVIRRLLTSEDAIEN